MIKKIIFWILTVLCFFMALLLLIAHLSFLHLVSAALFILLGLIACPKLTEFKQKVPYYQNHRTIFTVVIFVLAFGTFVFGASSSNCDHEWVEATCTEPATCSKCGDTKGDPLGHELKETTVMKEATCQEEGEEEGTCTRCGKTVTQAIPKTDHIEGEWVVETYPTESQAGNEVLQCQICGTVLDTRELTMSAQEIKQNYISQCQSYTYEEIARNPDDYEGKYGTFTGEVIQVLENDGQYELRVDITRDDWGYYSDTIYVVYDSQEGESRILEDDIITIYGEIEGMYTYESIMGAEITLPLVYAQYYDLVS